MTLRRFYAGAAVLLLPWATGCDAVTPVPDDAVVIRGVNVVEVDAGTVSENQTVVVQGRRIVAVAPAETVGPGGAVEIDGTGRYLIPGLWDMHTHVFNNNDPEQPPNEWTFPLMVAHGVLGVRDMWVRPEDVPQVESWNAAVVGGTLVAPYFAEIGTIIDGPGSSLLADTAATPAQARDFVRAYAASGVDFVKTYTRLTPETYEAVHDEAAAQGLSVLGHVPKQMRASTVAEMGARSVEHVDGFWVEWSTDEDSLRTDPEYSVYLEAPHALATYDSTKAAVAIEAMATHGTWQVPTLALWSASTVGRLDDFTALSIHDQVPEFERAEWEDMAGWMTFRASQPELTEAWRGLWGLLLSNVRAMHAAGVPFMAGTDIGNPYVYPGHSIHDELSRFVEAGFTPAEALRTATFNPALYLSATDSMGFVGTGAIASMVLLGGNPLDDIEHVRDVQAVVLQGQVHRRADLDAMMR